MLQPLSVPKTVGTTLLFLVSFSPRAGVNKGSFYYFFKTKADLAVEAYETHWKSNQPQLDQLFSPQVAPLDRLAQWCNHLYKAQKEKHGKTGCVGGCPYASVGTEI